MTNRNKLLSQIAKEHLLFPTLKTRRSDSLDFREVSVWAVEAALNAAFDAGQQAPDPESLDIHAFLIQRRQIAVIWSTEDVLEVRPDLAEDQAWKVLQEADRRHDATIGICWKTLKCFADELFSDAPETSDE